MQEGFREDLRRQLSKKMTEMNEMVDMGTVDVAGLDGTCVCYIGGIPS